MPRTILHAVASVPVLAQSGGALEPHGPVAREMERLWWIMFWLGLATFAIFAVALAFGLLRKGTAPDERAADEGSRTALWWIVPGGVVLPLVVVAVVFGFTLAAMRVIPNRAGPGAVVIEVVGNQWWWEARYPDHGVVTANEIHIPVGQPVELRLTSADVIHSFWVPELAGKMDLLPEDENILVLEADEPGEYAGACAEFCGLAHAAMRLLVVAEEAEGFQTWVADQQAPAAAPADATAQRGQQVFLNTCARCHTVRGTPADGTKGPDLTHFASRQSLGAGTLVNDSENLADWLHDPAQFKGGTEMPAADLPPDEMEALLAYLEGLR